MTMTTVNRSQSVWKRFAAVGGLGGEHLHTHPSSDHEFTFLAWNLNRSAADLSHPKNVAYINFVEDVLLSGGVDALALTEVGQSGALVNHIRQSGILTRTGFHCLTAFDPQSRGFHSVCVLYHVGKSSPRDVAWSDAQGQWMTRDPITTDSVAFAEPVSSIFVGLTPTNPHFPPVYLGRSGAPYPFGCIESLFPGEHVTVAGDTNIIIPSDIFHGFAPGDRHFLGQSSIPTPLRAADQLISWRINRPQHVNLAEETLIDNLWIINDDGRNDRPTPMWGLDLLNIPHYRKNGATVPVSDHAIVRAVYRQTCR